MIDNYINEVVSLVDYIFVVSDHGFGPQWRVFNLAKWLENNGFIYLKRAYKFNLFLQRIVKYIIKHKIIAKILPEKFIM